MSSICLIDTSVFLNILNVPRCNKDRESVMQNFQEYIRCLRKLNVSRLKPL